jgi:hypothetical protein
VPGSITFPGPPAPAVPIEVVAVVDDVGPFAEFARFPGAIDVVITQSGGPPWLPQVGTAWWLVSPHGHRVAAPGGADVAHDRHGGDAVPVW